MSRLQFDFSVRSICDICQDESINVPEHQRPEMWQQKRQEALIETIMSGRPMPNITFRFEVKDNSIVHWLEDGQQRYISITKFVDNNLSWSGRLFSDLTERERIHFLSYKVSILIYKNATIDETIKIFDDFQNGVALTPGQRFHARLNTRLVKYARERFLTHGRYYHTRMAAIFGPHDYTKDTKTKKNLMNAMALAGGVAHGVNFMTTSYDVLGPKLNDQFDEHLADAHVEKLLMIFETANEQSSCTMAHKKKLWPIGYITGYILATILNCTYDTYWMDKWVDYLVDIRNGVRTISILHYNMPACRSWNAERWLIGYRNIQNPPSDFEQDSNDAEDSD
jgi:hypothetical protein